MVDRRAFIASAVAAAALSPFSTTRIWALGIPQVPAARVIVDNDFAGDPDGLVALAHQLLAPRAVVPLVTVSLLEPKLLPPGKAPGRSVAEGVAVARELIRRLAPARIPAVVGGPEHVGDARSSAAGAIVAEAMRDDPLPLFVTCGGPLTNVAAALRLEPRIAGRMTVIWIGGGGYPDGGWEYNLATDADAAQTVFAAPVPLWQVPQPAYRQMAFSVAEMEAELRPISPFTEWLYTRFLDIPAFVKLPGVWPLGDSPLVLLSSIYAESSSAHDVAARRILPDLRYGAALPGRTIRVFDTVDARLTFADLLARLRLHAASGRDAAARPIARPGRLPYQ